MIHFSLILPTYNESKNVLILIPNIIEVLENAKIAFEIIVVDDDSKDLTWKVVQDKYNNDDRIRVIRRIDKKGLSSAVLDGFAVAKGMTLGVMDSDLQHDEKILPKLIQSLEEVEIAVGSRVVEDGGYGEWGFKRLMMSKIATLLAKIMLPISVGDPMSGFFVLRSELYQEYVKDINPRGFKILLEFIARKKNIKVKEVGFVFKNRIHGETKLSGIVVQNYIMALYDIRFGKLIPITFIKYIIIGLLGVFVNLGGQIFSSEVLHLKETGAIYSSYFKPSIAVIIGFELSVISNYILNNIWTFKSHMISGFRKNFDGMIRFQLVSIIGLIIQFSVWRFSLEFIQNSFPSLFPEQITTYICNMFGIILATAGNYYLNKNFTWVVKE